VTRHDLLRLAVRSELASITVCTTGSTSLAATTTGFTRTAGSFVTDGFEPGMQVTATGFGSASNNARWTVTAVATLTLTVDGTPTADTAASGRTLAVAMPYAVEYEDVEFTPPDRAPWMREELVSGPRRVISGPATNGTVEFDPLMHLHVFVPENSGPGALDRYADAIMDTFKPNATLTLSDGNIARVRTDASSYRGAIQHVRTGYSSVRVTIPWRMYLSNT